MGFSCRVVVLGCAETKAALEEAAKARREAALKWEWNNMTLGSPWARRR